MALPKVTYGNYNYGQYANPTAIRYRGGIGEGLAQGANAIAGAIVTGRKKVKAAEEQAYITSTAFEKDVNKALGDASAQNREFVIGLKQEVGDLVKAYKLNKIGLDEYAKGMDKYNGYLSDLQIMSGKVQAIASSDNPEIDLTTVRGGLDNIGSAMTRNVLQKGQFIISENETEDGLNFSLPSGLPSDFKIVNMSVKELVKDDRYYTPDIKFNFDATPIANSLLKNIKNSKEGNEAITYTRRSIGNLNKDLILSALSKEQKEAYFEDSIEGNKMGDYVGSTEQDQQIYNALSNEIKNKLLNLEFGHKDITAAVNRENQEQDNLLSAQRNFELYTSDIDGIKNYFIDRRLTYGRDNITEGSKPGSIKITSTIKNENDEDTTQSYELDLTNKETFRFVVGNMMRDDLKKAYPGVKSSEAVGQYNIDNVYNNFMKQIKNTTVKFNPETGEIEEKNNVEKAFEMDVPFFQQLKMIPGVRAGR